MVEESDADEGVQFTLNDIVLKHILRAAAKVDFPTPPFPDTIKILWRTAFILQSINSWSGSAIATEV
jgi:hypothetical protein